MLLVQCPECCKRARRATEPWCPLLGLASHSSVAHAVCMDHGDLCVTGKHDKPSCWYDEQPFRPSSVEGSGSARSRPDLLPKRDRLG